MTLKPTDMMEIQSAIDEYERKFPRRPAPSAEVALAWRLGKRTAAKVLANDEEPKPAARAVEKPGSVFAEQECSRLAWAWEQLRLQWNFSRLVRFEPASFDGSPVWVKGALRVGWWGMVALLTASVFCFGAIVGGLK